jgi:hypothetical protein
MTARRTTGEHSAPLPRLGRLAGRIAGRAWHLPPATDHVVVTRAIPVPGADGVRLLTDHYAPAAGSAGPVIMVRSPYGRMALLAAATAVPFAERGYHVILQSCRGTFGSTGEFEPMVNEIADGHATVAWLRDQPWFDGRLATMGPSYLAFAQWALAMDPPPEWRAAIVQFGPHDFGRAVYGQGAFDLGNFLGWADMVSHQESGGLLGMLRRSMTAPRRLEPVARALPMAGAADDLLGVHRSWYNDWVTHSDLADPFWTNMRLAEALRRIPVPTMLFGGWQDLFLEQTLEQYQVLRERGLDVRLTVGPWAHNDIVRLSRIMVGESLEWLDEHVRGGTGGGTGGRREHPVRVHVGGAGWRDLDHWPPSGLTEHTFHLHRGGGLDRAVPAGHGAATLLAYDPADPTPGVGGATMARDAGVRDNAPVESRADVLTFTSPPLEHVLEIYGRPVVEVHLTSDNPYADLFVRLCDVDTKGVSRNLCDQNIRLDPKDAHAGERPSGVDVERLVRVELSETAHRFGRGHRLRLQLTGGAFPRFARNLGTGEAPGTGSRIRPVRHEVHHDAGRPSRLVVRAG